jgi:hypothetical protein
MRFEVRDEEEELEYTDALSDFETLSLQFQPCSSLMEIQKIGIPSMIESDAPSASDSVSQKGYNKDQVWSNYFADLSHH